MFPAQTLAAGLYTIRLLQWVDRQCEAFRIWLSRVVERLCATKGQMIFPLNLKSFSDRAYTATS
jgi:hypothetical protein